MKKFLFLLLTLTLSDCASGSSPQKKGDFSDLVKSGKDVFFKDMTFDEDIDFTQFDKNLISEGVYQVLINSSITFQNCTFTGKVLSYRKEKNNDIILTSFQSNLSFIGCVFKNDVNFRASSVMGRTDFTNALFLKTASFEESTFFQNAYFRAASFHEELRFQNAVFIQKANFLNAQFDVTASFQLVNFHSEAQFSSTKFMGYADFGLINCKGNFFANYVEFANRSIFNNSLYFGQADFLNVRFAKCEMKNCKFLDEARFDNCTVVDQLDLDNSFFLFGIPELGSIEKEKLSLDGVKGGK
jgi:hypothetical protein